MTDAARDADFLEHAKSEIDALTPRSGEEPELDLRRRELQMADRIRGDVAKAAEALGPSGAEKPVFEAIRWLEGAASRADSALDPALDVLARLAQELSEAASAVDQVLSSLEGDPGELEVVEERLFAIRALARKHNVPPDDLSGLARDLAGRLTELEDRSTRIDSLIAESDAADIACRTLFSDLSLKRRAAASRLDAAIAVELEPLKLGRGRFLNRGR